MDIEKVEQKENAVFFEQNGSNFYKQVEYLESLMINSGSPDVVVGNSEALPLTHTFCDGIYVREIFLKQGVVAIGKIHKHDHAFFLLKGKLMLCTEKGVEEMIAPCYGKSPAGTKRVVIAVEDSIFVNVHPNPDNEEDIEQLEEKFVVSSFEDYNKYKQLK
jgi:hypothetical protein